MTGINLKEQAVIGATVHFRCGGKAVVEKWGVNGADFYFEFKGDKKNIYRFGNSGKATRGAILDIIRIDPPEFDWSTVKSGMAFKNHKGSCFWFMCHDWHHKDMVWVARKDDCSVTGAFPRINLTRAPEHDIEVK